MSRHRFDAVSFVFGVLFVAVAVTGLVGLDRIRPVDVAMAGPGLLILLGLVVLLTASRNGDSDEPLEERPAGHDERAVEDPDHGPLREPGSTPGGGTGAGR